MSNIIGHISLNISFMMYLIYFAPQLWHNRHNHHIQALSLGLHVLFIMTNLADLCYGFGRHMQWQYRVVTLITLIALAIQHWQLHQFFKTTCHHSTKWRLLNYAIGTFILLAMLLLLFDQILPSIFYIQCGLISNTGILFIYLPQIYKNYKIKSAEGLSSGFIYLALSTALLDLISTICLNWDWPSFIGPTLGIISLSILLYQKITRKHIASSLVA
ncbi:MAG: hypothetical protein A3F17_02155 [Gammaproteobacteria bacterium RIFCSPHIGHO2_12_FULL_41_15]|nr:MAG: hypothetical protein A3F17_02155 [Gammaproteobacteria bacterium RIFCSPHIGHO2_12_FULL_41_15]